ncbi:23S rRNA (guanosine(2251)-2'-O)-methyltransferase RlmB [Vampirovibrio sp.]|uniref:23S rRNA (guanosine(2251)-2'-O)-methyltransferase RlmB n=1 Tax=Vampirovibrio sp. TaxID=2717857 RepID=UPI0035948062
MSGGSRYVYGKNSVKALLDASPDKVFKIFLAEGLKPDKRVQSIHEMARDAKIPVQVVPRQKLDQMLRSQESAEAAARPEGHVSDEEESITHQGVVASVAPKTLLNLPALLKLCQSRKEQGQHPRLLMLDGVTDPRNFGAILRVADAAGIDGVIIPKQHSAGFGPAVTKTASGAEEIVNIAVVSNLNQAIQQAKDAGFWVAGAANDTGAVDYHRQDYQMPVLLIMGSEGKGLASLVKKNCDFLVKIPMHGTVDSLNVATATAVLLFEMVKR